MLVRTGQQKSLLTLRVEIVLEFARTFAQSVSPTTDALPVYPSKRVSGEKNGNV